jgi:hypothetical protein
MYVWALKFDFDHGSGVSMKILEHYPINGVWDGKISKRLPLPKVHLELAIYVPVLVLPTTEFRP